MSELTSPYKYNLYRTLSEPSKPQEITNQPTPVQEPQSTPTSIIEPTAASINISLPNPSVLTMDGSTTMVTLMQKLRNAYAQINPNIPTIYGQPDGFPKGSTKGFGFYICTSFT